MPAASLLSYVKRYAPIAPPALHISRICDARNRTNRLLLGTGAVISGRSRADRAPFACYGVALRRRVGTAAVSRFMWLTPQPAAATSWLSGTATSGSP